MQSLIILGRQPKLGLAELESLYGADKITPVGDIAAMVDVGPAEINFARLGGMVKFCKLLTILETTSWKDIQEFLENVVSGHASQLPEGKLSLGLSAYELKVSPQQMMATGLTLKKIIRAGGRPVRIVPNVETDLNAAQVLHNKLTQKLGWELVFVRDGNKTIVAQSIAVQDIERYAARDQNRPYRDSRVGMLPPKLAQQIINLAVDGNKQQAESSKQTILDPFCGTGVILQEALLMRYAAYGSDLDPRMVDYSQKNLDWLFQKYAIAENRNKVLQGDATTNKWFSQNSELKAQSTVIACETYLGRPLSSLPDSQTLQKIVQDCDTIHKKFLRNVARQTEKGFRLCIAVPAWKTKNGFKHLPTLDSLEELGYNRVKFVHARAEDLIYHRSDQIVARELVTLIRK